MAEEKIMATAEEAARMLAIGRSTFWAQVKAGTLPQPIKIGGSTRWRVADLRLVGHQANQPTTGPTLTAA